MGMVGGQDPGQDISKTEMSGLFPCHTSWIAFPQKGCVSVQTLVPVNATLFVNGIFADVIKVKSLG